MQVDAIYNNGRLEFSKSIRFKRTRFKVKVELPEQEIIHDTSQFGLFGIEEPLSKDALAWLEELKKIQQTVMNIPEDQLPEITTEQLERLEAIEMREER